jgi:predicted PurR-regulated permease PerM
MERSRKVAQQYLGGLSLMVMSLWIMYGIGFTIAGVKNAVFFAVLCGLLEIVPFIGNLAGTAITLLMALAQGGSTGTLLGVVITYGVVQFVQSYLIEPLVVGKGVRINPLFTILSLVAGEFIWGIAGMVLALPAIGILKVLFDHIGPLKPVGKLIGDSKPQKS